MNFFRKKNAAHITLEGHDFSAPAAKLWNDLVYAMDGHKVEVVTLKLYETDSISLGALSVVVSLGLKLQNETISLNLEAPSRMVHVIRRMNLASAFSNITEGA